MSVTRTILKSSGPHDYNKSYKKYSIVDHTIDNVTKTYLAISNVPQRVSILDEHYWQEIPSGRDETVDYNNLEHKPTINGVELDGNKTSEDLGVYSKPSSGIPQSDLSSDVQTKLNKHFKGWYASEDTLPSNPVVGDYAYVKGAESTDPAAIYECTVAGSWNDSERTVDTNNVQTFETGEEVNEVGIDDEPTVGSENLVKSGGVYLEEKLLENVSLGSSTYNYIDSSTLNWCSSNVNYHYNVSVKAGEVYKVVNNPGYRVRYAFLKSIPPIEVTSATSVDYCDNTTLYAIESEEAQRYITIPDDCVCLYVLAGDVNYSYPNTPTLYIVISKLDGAKDKTHLANPTDENVAMATDAMQLKAKLEGITATETKATIGEQISGYINGNGIPTSVSSSSTTTYVIIPLNNANNVRLLGSTNSSTGTNYTSYAFWNASTYVDSSTVVEAHNWDVREGSTSYAKEYTLAVPNGATHIAVTLSTQTNQLNFYCYLQKGDNLGIEIKATRDYLAWKLCAPYRIYLSSGIYLVYIPCVANELFKIDNLNNKNSYYGFCKTKPTSASDIEHTQIDVGSYIIKAPIDGYFCVYKENVNNIYIYKADTLCFTELYTETIDVTNTTRKNRLLIVNDDSSNYNTLVLPNNDNYYANTEYIDISNYTAVGLLLIYSTISFLKQNRQNQDIPGAIFYNNEYIPIESVPLMTYNTQNRTDIIRIAVPNEAKYLKASYSSSYRFVLGYSKRFNTIPAEDRIEEIIRDNAAITGSRTVFETNTDDEIKPKLDALCKSVRHSSVLSSKSVVFGHISDCHGSGATGSTSENTWNRFIDFMNHWDAELDDIVDTGDMVSGTYTDGIAWRTNSEKVLTVIGNHDSHGEGASEEGAVWRVHIADCYDTYIKNNIDNWNVVQPENAEELGKCYYYKDYAKSGYNESTSSTSTLTIRAIFLDCMGWGYGNDSKRLQAQWLSDVLDDALTNSYKVVIFCHFPPMRWRKIDCSYSSYSKGIGIGSLPSWGTSLYNRYFEEVSQIVYKFQIAGGVFLGYITGHYHYDCIGQVGGCWDFVNHTEGNIDDAYNGDTVTSFDVINFDNELYPQMVFVIGKGNVKLADDMSDYKMSSGTKNNDNFQLIAFNAYANVARLAKIGCNIDVHMRKKDTIEVFTGQISAFDPNNVSYTEGTKVEKDGIIYRLIKPIVINNQTSWESSVKEISSRINL